MNDSKTKTDQSNPLDRGWWTNKRILCIGLVLAAAVYVLAQPTLERWTGLDLPDLIEQDGGADQGERSGADNKPAAVDSTPGTETASKSDSESNKKAETQPDASAPSRSKFDLRETGRNRFQSPEGLVYTMGPRNEHRIDHVMRHAKNDATRDGPHGVFDADTRDEVLALLDRAYKLAKAGDKNVSRKEGDRGRTELTIDMPQRIGYVGGKAGARQNNPATRRLKLILQDDRVITAYPTWPPRRGRR